MTKAISRKMAVDCLLWLLAQQSGDHVMADVTMDGRVISGVVYRYRCYLCRRGIKVGDSIQFDHVHADVFGGPHEYQNLRPVHTDCHKKKTKMDVQANAKAKRIAAGGRKRKGPKMKSGNGFQKRDKKSTQFTPRAARQLEND